MYWRCRVFQLRYIEEFRSRGSPRGISSRRLSRESISSPWSLRPCSVEPLRHGTVVPSRVVGRPRKSTTTCRLEKCPQGNGQEGLLWSDVLGGR